MGNCRPFSSSVQALRSNTFTGFYFTVRFSIAFLSLARSRFCWNVHMSLRLISVRYKCVTNTEKKGSHSGPGSVTQWRVYIKISCIRTIKRSVTCISNSQWRIRTGLSSETLKKNVPVKSLSLSLSLFSPVVPRAVNSITVFCAISRSVIIYLFIFQILVSIHNFDSRVHQVWLSVVFWDTWLVLDWLCWWADLLLKESLSNGVSLIDASS